MTSEQENIASVYIGYFAARDDAYNAWSGEHWFCKREPLTPAVVVDAFRRNLGIGAYMQRPDGLTHVCAVDFDTDDGWQRARVLRDVMDGHGAFAYIEPSRRGAHLYSVLDDAIPARTVRRALRGFLGEALIDDRDPKVELRPSHDEIKPEGFGSPIRMPTMPHPKTGKRYPLCGPDDRPLGAKLSDILLRIEWASAAAFIEMAAKVPIDPALLDRAYRRPTVLRPEDPPDSVSLVLGHFWGTQAVPGRTIRCPLHDDRSASLSVLADDQRAICKSPSCDLNNGDHGVGPGQLRRLAEARGLDLVSDTVAAAG